MLVIGSRSIPSIITMMMRRTTRMILFSTSLTQPTAGKWFYLLRCYFDRFIIPPQVSDSDFIDRRISLNGNRGRSLIVSKPSSRRFGISFWVICTIVNNLWSVCLYQSNAIICCSPLIGSIWITRSITRMRMCMTWITRVRIIRSYLSCRPVPVNTSCPIRPRRITSAISITTPASSPLIRIIRITSSCVIWIYDNITTTGSDLYFASSPRSSSGKNDCTVI